MLCRNTFLFGGCFIPVVILCRYIECFDGLHPNVFAPNSSHFQNAIFRPFVTNKVERINYMRVFNRWGAKVYERTDFPIEDESTGWDGRFNGNMLNTGVYIYLFEIEFIDGSVRKYSGDVTLLR